MTSPRLVDVRDALRRDMMPHILCPGCGHGIVLKALLRAIHRLGLRREEVVFVSGIGCSSRIVGYIDFCTLHTPNGRPLTFATGIKLARPGLRVIVITGDGDGLAIGGNHLIHAARRNIDVTCLLLNNAIFQRDLPVLQGTILVLAMFFVALNLAVDLVQTALDPRIKRA